MIDATEYTIPDIENVGDYKNVNDIFFSYHCPIPLAKYNNIVPPNTMVFNDGLRDCYDTCSLVIRQGDNIIGINPSFNSISHTPKQFYDSKIESLQDWYVVHGFLNNSIFLVMICPPPQHGIFIIVRWEIRCRLQKAGNGS